MSLGPRLCGAERTGATGVRWTCVAPAITDPLEDHVHRFVSQRALPQWRKQVAAEAARRAGLAPVRVRGQRSGAQERDEERDEEPGDE